MAEKDVMRKILDTAIRSAMLHQMGRPPRTLEVSDGVKGLRLKDFRGQPPNRLTKRASLPAAGRFTITLGL